MEDFITVAETGEVAPGTMRAVQAGGEDVALANVEGTIVAFGDICTHQECSLSDGDLEGWSVICACHGSEFDVRTGEVLSPPATRPVPVFEVRVVGGEVQVAP